MFDPPSRTGTRVAAAILLAIAASIAFAGCATHRGVVPTVSEAPRPILSLRTPILVSILDGRAEKSNTEETVAAIQGGLCSAYGSSIELVDFFTETPADRVAVRLRILALGADFGSRVVSGVAIATESGTMEVRACADWRPILLTATSSQTVFASSFSGEGWWIGAAWVDLAVQDRRRGRDLRFSIPFVAETKESNTWGYASASRAAEAAWRAIWPRIMQTFDSVLLKVRDEE